MGSSSHKLDGAARARIAQVGRIEVAPTIAVLVPGLWLTIFQWPFWIIMMVMLVAPPLALAALVPLRAWFADLPPHERPTLVGPLVLASLTLFIGAASEFDFLDGDSYDLALVIAAVVLGAPLYFLRKRRRTRKTPAWMHVWGATAVLFLALVYGWGAVKLLDVGLDTAPPAVYRTAVTGKEFIRRYRSLADRQLTLAPWGPGRIAIKVNVPNSLYDSVIVGSTICARLHPGYFGLRWYEVDGC